MGLPRNVVIWGKNGHRFVCKIEACNASYLTKYLLIKIYVENTIFPQNQGSSNVHLFIKKGCIIKTMHQ
jgi:hypothetical protein